jgi:hypothetical protein
MQWQKRVRGVRREKLAAETGGTVQCITSQQDGPGLHSALLYSTLLVYSTTYFTPLYSTQLYSTLLYSTYVLYLAHTATWPWPSKCTFCVHLFRVHLHFLLSHHFLWAKKNETRARKHTGLHHACVHCVHTGIVCIVCIVCMHPLYCATNAVQVSVGQPLQ